MKNTRQPYPHVETFYISHPDATLQDFALEIGSAVAYSDNYSRFKLVLPSDEVKKLTDAKVAIINSLLKNRIIKAKLSRWPTKNTFVVQRVDN